MSYEDRRPLKLEDHGLPAGVSVEVEGVPMIAAGNWRTEHAVTIGNSWTEESVGNLWRIEDAMIAVGKLWRTQELWTVVVGVVVTTRCLMIGKPDWTSAVDAGGVLMEW